MDLLSPNLQTSSTGCCLLPSWVSVFHFLCRGSPDLGPGSYHIQSPAPPSGLPSQPFSREASIDTSHPSTVLLETVQMQGHCLPIAQYQSVHLTKSKQLVIRLASTSFLPNAHLRAQSLATRDDSQMKRHL